MDNATFTAIDFETANSNSFSICQVGLVRVEKGKIRETFSWLVKPPNNKYSRLNSTIHGINAAITENAPTFVEIWDDIRIHIENQLIIAHNASFDISCLECTLKHYNLDIPNFYIDCTYRKTNASLIEACQAFEIQLDNHHEALQDALACAKIYLCLLDNKTPDYSKVVTMPKQSFFGGPGHERLTGDLLKPNLERANPNSLFYRKKVVFTGVLVSIEREEAARIVKNLGADVDTTITPKTNYVIVGNEPGRVKLRQIEKFNGEGSSIQIIEENELLRMIKLSS